MPNSTFERWSCRNVSSSHRREFIGGETEKEKIRREAGERW
jgi:hypothetical protein